MRTSGFILFYKPDFVPPKQCQIQQISIVRGKQYLVVTWAVQRGFDDLLKPQLRRHLVQ